MREFAVAHPVKANFARRGNLPSTATDDEGLNWILATPLKAVQPFSGINATAKALSEFTQVADEFKTIVTYIPEDIALRIEYLLTDVEERGMMVKLNDSISQVANAADSFAASADELPEDMKEVLSHAFSELEKSTALRETVVETRTTAEEVNRGIDRLDTLLTSLDHTIESVTGAGEAWAGVGVAFGLDQESEEPEEEDEGPSFAEEWSGTALGVTNAALEIRQLLADVRDLTSSSDEESLTESAIATVDHVTWRLVQLVLVVFAVATGYRYIALRMHRRMAS